MNFLTDKCYDDCKKWLDEQGIYDINFDTIEYWMLNALKTYIIPVPASSDKYNYKSFPIMAWRYDLLSPNNYETNSYYYGYPHGDILLFERDETIETIGDDYGFDTTLGFMDMKKLAIKYFNKLYNKRYDTNR